MVAHGRIWAGNVFSWRFVSCLPARCRGVGLEKEAERFEHVTM